MSISCCIGRGLWSGRRNSRTTPTFLYWQVGINGLISFGRSKSGLSFRLERNAMMLCPYLSDIDTLSLPSEGGNLYSLFSASVLSLPPLFLSLSLSLSLLSLSFNRDLFQFSFNCDLECLFLNLFLRELSHSFEKECLFNVDGTDRVAVLPVSMILTASWQSVWNASTAYTVPTGSPLRAGDATVCVWHKPVELDHSLLFCSCVYFCHYGPFNCILFYKFSRQLFAFSLCSSGLISTLLVLSTVYLFMKVSFSPDIIFCGWLGLKHQLTN